MKAIQYHRFGGPEVLEYVDVPVPSPGASEVLIETTAVGVNFPDVRERLGIYNQKETRVGGVTLPQIGGVQVVGKVVDAGSGVSADLRGRKVMAIMIKGAYAQFAVAQTIMTGEWRPERHNQGECCCDASTEPHTRGAQDAPGTPMSRRHRPGSAQLMDYTCANPPSTNNSVPVRVYRACRAERCWKSSSSGVGRFLRKPGGRSVRACRWSLG